jgi:hypothetical protein
VATVICASARSLPTAVMMAFMAVFWNGITWFFVLSAAASTVHHLGGGIPAWAPGPLHSAGSGMPLAMALFVWIFIMPFVAIGLMLIAAFLVSLTGRIEVRVRDHRGSVFIGVGPIVWRRRFDPVEVKSVSIGETTWAQNEQRKPVVVIDCGRKIRFGSTLPEERRAWLGAITQTILVPGR